MRGPRTFQRRKEALKRISLAFVHCDGLQGGACVGSGRPRVGGIEGLGLCVVKEEEEEDRPVYVVGF